MKEEDLRLLASLVDWSESNKLMMKSFYKTFGATLHEKFNEFEEARKEIKDYIRDNFNDKVPKTPKRCNPTAKLFDQIQQMELANFESEDSDNEDDNQSRKPPIRFPQRVLKQLENMGIQNQPKQGQLQSTVSRMRNKTMAGDATNATAHMEKAPTTLVLPQSSTESCLTPKMHKTFASSSKSANAFTSSTNANRDVAAAAISRAQPTATALEKQQQRLREKELQAARRREEALKIKAERARRDHDERQRRVEENNRLRREQQLKAKQEMREKEDRLRKFRQGQEDIERDVRSPAAKNRKLGTPHSNRKPQATYRMPPQQHQSTADIPMQVISPVSSEQKHESVYLNNQEDAATESPDHSFNDAMDVAQENNSGNVVETLPSAAKQHRDAPTNEEGVKEHSNDADDEEENEGGAEKFITPHSIQDDEVVEAEDSIVDLSPPKPVAAKVQQPRSHSYDMTPDKIFLPSTKENYNVDDLSSADETDNEENPRKQIPKWACKSNLTLRIGKLRTLVTTEQIERHFGRIREPDINTFFGNFEKKYAVRSSSAIWDSPMSDPTPGFSRFCN